VFVDDFEFDWRKDGQQVQSSGEFTQGVNVEFVKIRDPLSIETRFFERGVGETMSSGTGSCAAAIAAIHSGKCRSPLEVRSPGGPQIVQWEAGAEVILQGPAKLVFSGEFFG
jgi:diaminopimelate epimerase